MDYPFDIDLGELVPGHRIVARGVRLDGAALALHYEFVPGVVEQEVPQGPIPLLFDCRYDTDGPVEDGGCDSGAMAPAEDGPSTHGYRVYPPPATISARIWFDLGTAGRLTLDLDSGQAIFRRCRDRR
jgi:hypothetical protein